MTNGSQSAGPVAAQAAIANSMSICSSEQAYDMGHMERGISNSVSESIPEEDVGDESDMEHVTKSIGFMKVNNNHTIFASEAHWYAILGEVGLAHEIHRLKAHVYSCRKSRITLRNIRSSSRIRSSDTKLRTAQNVRQVPRS